MGDGLDLRPSDECWPKCLLSSEVKLDLVLACLDVERPLSILARPTLADFVSGLEQALLCFGVEYLHHCSAGFRCSVSDLTSGSLVCLSFVRL
jgi:hypothetical protein